MIELVKQVGDLARRVMVTEGSCLADRDVDPRYASGKAEIAHELVDILHGIIELADHYQIDLETANIAARQRELEQLERTSIGQSASNDEFPNPDEGRS
jgi:hypothetical protein